MPTEYTPSRFEERFKWISSFSECLICHQVIAEDNLHGRWFHDGEADHRPVLEHEVMTEKEVQSHINEETFNAKADR